MTARIPDLPGLDPAWSRLVDVGHVAMHVLERPAHGDPAVTLLAVHGNPTWSYLWRRLLAEAPADWRVIAVDQIGMGYSDRPPGVRRLADRVADLGRLTEAMEVTGPVVTVAHDWGGPVSLGWALAHRDMLAGVVLANTAVHQPEGSPAPTLIRLARSRPLLDAVTRRTTTFLRGTTAMSRGMDTDTARAFRAPYPDAASRRAIRDFVADIPLSPEHPSAETLDAIADGVCSLGVPVLLAWGSDDPVFSDRYLRDLRARMPHADVHRYEKARHLVTEDAPGWAIDVIAWIADRVLTPERVPVPVAPTVVPMGQALDDRLQDLHVAVADLRSDRRVSWAMLATRTREIAAGLVAMGVRPGDRVALLVTPSADLIACVYAAWRIGAVVVVADSGLGVRGMRRALRSAEATHVIGIPAGLGLARTLTLPGVTILVGRTGPATRVLGADASLSEVARRGRDYLASSDLPTVPPADADALVAFTSGATGPAKGVVYTHARLAHLRDALRAAYSISDSDALVAAFAPWSVLGPALGIPSAIPDMDLTDASTLTARALADATAAVGGTLAWASPTALRAVVDSGDHLDEPRRAALAGLRFLLVAGAPVPVDLLERAASLLPAATLATPYGMTEALPLTEVTLDELRAASGRGVLVGRPLAGVDIAIAPLDAAGVPATQLIHHPHPAEWSVVGSSQGEDDPTTDHSAGGVGVTGEIVVRCDWMRDRYDRRWATQHRADSPRGWHRTGDVGHLDEQGRLWVEGRLAHVLVTADGPVTPVAAELVAQRTARVPLAALVGVGPAGAQVPVIVLLAPGPSLGLADVDTTTRVRDAVRESTGLELATVLTMRSLPVDVRHRSKVDRTRIAREAGLYLAGERGDG